MPTSARRAHPFNRSKKRQCWHTAARSTPESFEEYIAVGGYGALAKTITEMTPEQVCQEVTPPACVAGAGRGSPPPQVGVSPAWCRPTSSTFVCNGDEGDPAPL
jgi:NADH:ubiquinone oxidoreductase subunit F (NADH-binding)